MILCIVNEYLAKSFIPYYKLQFEAMEAANQLVEIYDDCIRSDDIQLSNSVLIKQRLLNYSLMNM